MTNDTSPIGHIYQQHSRQVLATLIRLLGDSVVDISLSAEAIRLAEVLAELLPEPIFTVGQAISTMPALRISGHWPSLHKARNGVFWNVD